MWPEHVDEYTIISDFREIGIFPQITDICTDEEPFLRVNKDKGAYDDVDHYLDVQFRLLREDFIGPLRNGVAEYLQNQHGLRSSRKLQDIRIYKNVRIIRPKCSDHGLSYVLQFDTSQLGKIDWESSKQLIYGSLVCLSPDNFRTLYFATVQDREPKEIRFGRLLVKFQHDHLVVKALAGRSFIMAETKAYFESYRHVLLALQSTATNELPFEKYIVKCECQVNVPSYLVRHSKFDIRPLVDDNFILKTHSILGITHQNRQTLANAHEKDKLCEISNNPVMVDILKRDDWPSASRLHMDRPQRKAIYTALTNEFVITQGPPGTGKTYIGLKIVKTLLHNKLNWSKHPVTGAPDHRPMLIVCYTNHALDQFLEGIVAFYRGDILRIGGRSTSKLLENCNLRNVRQCVRNKYRTNGKVKATTIPGVSARILQNRRLAKRDLFELSKQIDRISSYVKGASTRILNETILREYMEHAYERLVKPFNHEREYKFDFIILEWLGLGNVELVQPLLENDNAAECHTMEELIEVIDDADSRILDVDNTDDDTNDDGDGDTIAKTNVPSACQEEDMYVNTEYQQHTTLNRWQSAKDKKKVQNHILHRMASSEVMTEYEINGIRDLWRINIDDRWKMYRRWVQTYCQDCLNRIAKMEDKFDAAAARYQQSLREEDTQIMKVATVIGMTTTGAARYHSVLKKIRPRIVVVEEAAEVYEAHIMAALTKGCDHLIMIGDHKQLKPSPAVYKLATYYNLDISLFERMVLNGMPCECLVFQHRMRPEISCFMNHIYSNIRDHEDVKKYENIKGISNNIYCVDHTVPETHSTDTRSHVNEYEAEYIVSLCKYLLLQGYAASQITVLSMYSGQLLCLRKCMQRAEFGGILVTTVDNYQGEENDIILLSLVRSNSGGYIGFLKIENRVCVALSRAKKGMYIIGNFDCMSKQSSLWKAIRKDMQQKGLIGKGLHLYCQNHPIDDGIYAIKKADFARAPEGGCKKNCDFRLQCGHVCRRKCHVIDSEHVQYKCMEDCLTRCAENHRCRKRCHEECGTCPCRTVLECGHQCAACCGEKHTTTCEVMVERTWTCGHKKMVKCYQKNNTAHIPDVSSCIDRAFRSIVAVNVTTGHVYEVGDEFVGRHDSPKCQTCEDAKRDARRRKLVDTRPKDVYDWRDEYGLDRYAGTTHTTTEKKNALDLRFQAERKENYNSQTMQRTQRKSVNEARSHSHGNQRTTDDSRSDAMSRSQNDRRAMDDASRDTKRNGGENRVMMGKAAFGSKRHVIDGTKQTCPIDANREHNKKKTFKKAVGNRGEPTRETTYQLRQDPRRNFNTNCGANVKSRNEASRQTEAKWKITGEIGRKPRHCVEVGRQTTSMGSEVGRNAKDKTAYGSGNRTEYIGDTKDKAANESGRWAEYKRDTKDKAANMPGHRAEYNRDTKENVANGSGRKAEYNRDAMNSAASWSGRRAEYNRDTNENVANGSGRKAEYNRDALNSAASWSGRRAEYNRDTKDKAANGSGRQADYNGDVKDNVATGSGRWAEYVANGSGRRAEYNRDTKDKVSTGSGRRVEYNRDTKDDVTNGPGHRAEYNRDTKDKAANGLGRRAEYNRDTKDKAANGLGHRVEYNRDTKDNASNGLGRRVEYNRDTKDKAANGSGRRAEYNRDTKDKAASGSGRRAEYNRDSNDDVANGPGHRVEYNRDIKDKAANGLGRRAEYNRDTKDKAANGLGHRAEYNRDTKDKAANGLGRRAEYSRDTMDKAANGLGHRAEYNRVTKDKAASGSGRRAEYNRDTKENATNGSARMAKYNRDTKDDAAIWSGCMTVYNQDTKDKAAPRCLNVIQNIINN